MRIVKERLREMVPGISVYLDVDNLGGGAHFPHVDVSNVVVCFCTKHWFTSPPCIREVVRAVATHKPLIALLEPESGKGGHTEAECRDILRGDTKFGSGDRRVTYEEKMQECIPGVIAWEEWKLALRQPNLPLPTAKQVEDALFAQPPPSSTSPF